MGLIDFLLRKKKNNSSEEHNIIKPSEPQELSAYKPNDRYPASKEAAKSVFKPFVFESNQHQRYENDEPVLGVQVCPRTIKVEENINGCDGYRLAPRDGYIVRLINGDSGQLQMSPKPMRIARCTDTEVTLRGYVVTAAAPFGYQMIDQSEYGLTVSLEGTKVVKCTLYMHDRNVKIEYRKEALSINEKVEESEDEDINLIIELACRVNMAHNTGNTDAARELCRVLFNNCSHLKYGTDILVRLHVEGCQAVGLAFTIMALEYDYNNQDANSCAAENAFYCLSRSLVEKDNRYVAPALFSILYREPYLMKDKLIASWASITQQRSEMPKNMILGGNPYRDSQLEEFRQQAFGFKDHIMYYLVTRFFNLESREFGIPTNLPYFIPSRKVVDTFLKSMEASYETDKTFITSCEEHFLSVYRECEDTIKNLGQWFG